MNIRKKLEDYNAGKLSSAEKEALKELLDNATEEELSALFPTDAYEQPGGFQLPDDEVNAALERFRKKKRSFISIVRISRYAAVIMLIMGCAFILRKTMNSRPERHYRSMRVQDGKQGSLILPDGSRITINGGSEVLFPEAFNGADRTVYLKNGEAYFEVAQDAEHPFIVKSPQVLVRVLGTAFSVRNYKDEKHLSVAVSSGRIAIGKQELCAGMGWTMNKDNGRFSGQNIDTARAIAWTKGELIFQNAGLQQVLQVLQHKYAVHFDVKNQQLFKRKFTATFTNNTIENIMQQLHLMGNLQYKITDNQILIQ